VTGPEPLVEADLLRVLRALRTESVLPEPRRAIRDERLPRRIPGTNLVPQSPWAVPKPLRVVRDASSIALTAPGYMRGWQRGREAAIERQSAAALRGTAIRPAAAALRLVVQVLPERERGRYHEEFRAELNRLQGLEQLGYAVRLLLSAFALRRALRPGPGGEE
jgi:hypothetical protein